MTFTNAPPGYTEPTVSDTAFGDTLSGPLSYSKLPAGTWIVKATDTVCSVMLSTTISDPVITALVYGVHNYSDCTTAGGTVYTDNSFGVPVNFCRFNEDEVDTGCTFAPTVFPDGTTSNSLQGGCDRRTITTAVKCPTGWTQYRKWSAWSTDRKYVNSNFMKIDYGSTISGCLADSSGPHAPNCATGYLGGHPDAVCTFPEDGKTLPFADYNNNVNCPTGVGYGWRCDNGYPSSLVSREREWKKSYSYFGAAKMSDCPSDTTANATSSSSPYRGSQPYYCTKTNCLNISTDYDDSSKGLWHDAVAVEVGLLLICTVALNIPCPPRFNRSPRRSPVSSEGDSSDAE